MATLQQRDWADLPADLLQSVAARLTPIPDLIRFSSVCIQWRSAAKSVSSLLPPQFPWLLLRSIIDLRTTSRLFYDLANNRTYNIPLSQSRRIQTNNIRSSKAGGWILTPKGIKALALINPLTNSSISLPSLSLIEPRYKNIEAYGLRKAKVFGPDLVAAFFPRSGDFLFCRLGESSWRSIELQCYGLDVDFAYHDARFYIRRSGEDVSIFDVHTLEKIGEVRSPSYYFYYSDDFLVESPRGELLLVRGASEVFCLDKSGEKMFWVKLRSLGDYVLFVDDVQAMAFCASDLGGCRSGNCIYYVSNLDKQKKDNVRLSLIDKEKYRWEELFTFTSHCHWGKAMWIVPCLD